MTTYTLRLPTLHKQQRMVKASARRFTVLACGRRWGKTTLLEDVFLAPALQGDSAGWFAPTYKLLLEVWRDCLTILAPVLQRDNASEHRMELITGGALDFWTLTDRDAGRGRKYRRLVVDEAGLVRDLAAIWHAALRPTLADYQGDAWIAGTPKGRNDFWTLWQQGGHGADWVSWQLPTDGNPHLEPDEIAAMRASLPALVVAQELDAQFTEGELTLFRVTDIDRAVQQGQGTPLSATPGRSYLTSIDVGRRQDATVINTFDVSQLPYQRVAFARLERVSYPGIQQAIDERARRWPGMVVVESNGIGDPVIENLTVRVMPFVTTAKSKLQALQALQLLFEHGHIAARWDARERAALLACSWDDDHTADEVMSLAIAAHSLHTLGTPGL